MLKNQNYNINYKNNNNYNNKNNYNKNYNYYNKNDTNNPVSNDINKIKVNSLINDLQDYMFCNKKLVSSLKMKMNSNNINQLYYENNNIVNNKIMNKKNESNKFRVKTKNPTLNDDKSILKKQFTFYPSEKDNLFWCFYIFKNGIENYHLLHDKNIIVEKKIKIEYVELLRKQKKNIKNYKIAPLSYIENFLVNEEKIDLKTFLTLCIIENLNIMYIHKKTFFENIISETDDEINDTNLNDIRVNILVKSEENINKYGCELNVLNEKIKDYRNKYYKLENIDKPVKAFSSYKLEDLIKLCEKLAIDILNPLTNKKKTKKELYESIIQYF